MDKIQTIYDIKVEKLSIGIEIKDIKDVFVQDKA